MARWLTSEAGLYNFVRLRVGRYSLAIEAAGFAPVKRPGIVLTIGAIATLDVQLTVGTAAESVTVTAETPVVETTRSQRRTAKLRAGDELFAEPGASSFR